MRSPERLRDHYEIEKHLADRLRSATRQERRELYQSVYDELFQSVPDHPMLTRVADPEAERRAVARQVQVLARFVRPGCTFLEVGPGDCRVSYAIAAQAAMVYGVDVSEEITRSDARPGNFELLLTNGTDIPVPDGSVDVAYSNQLMEHLHPDDAREQVENLARAIVPGGVYICATPNRLSGPHDISGYFDDVAKGLHLREYTTGELRRLFVSVGFVRVRCVFRANRFVLVLPSGPFAALEWVLERLPNRITRRTLRGTPLGKLLPTRLVATKAP